MATKDHLPKEPHTTWHRWRRFLSALIAFLIPMALVVAPAEAAIGSATLYKGEKYGTGYGYYFGSYKLSNGEIVYCAIQPGNQVGPPALLNGGSIKPTYGSIKKVTTHTAVKTGGTKVTVSGKTLGRIAYVVSNWGTTTSAKRAIAIERLALEKTGAGMSTAAEYNTRYTSDLVDEMWDESAKYYGPYKTSTSMSVDSDHKGAAFTGVGVKSAAGNWVPGYDITLKITGSALWKANGTKTLKLTSKSESLTRNMDILGAGDVSVTMTVSNLPEHRLVIREPNEKSISGNTPQDVMIAGITQDISASESVTATVTPKIVTKTSVAKTTPGSAITDTLTVSEAKGAWPGSTAVTVTSTLWGPLDTKPTERTSVPSGTAKVGSVTTKITGPGTYKTPAVTLPQKKGYYVWTESSPATGNIKAWSSNYGVAAEITYADWADFGYEITTQTSKAVAAKAESITDKLTVKVTSGTWVPGHSIKVTSTLYGPLPTKPAESATIPSGAAKVGSVTTKITGAGTYTTPAIKLPSTSGYYVWVDSAPKTDYAAAWQSKFGVASETTLIPWTQSASTAASIVLIDQAEKTVTLKDSVRITGAKPNSTVTGRFKLYFAGTSKPVQTASVPSSASLIQSKAFSKALPASGTLTFDSAEFLLEAGYAEGYYTFVVELDALGDGATSKYVSAYGIPVETLKLDNPFNFPPSVTTVASAAVAGPGDELSDELIVRDSSRVISAAQPLEIVSRLWGPLQGVDVGDEVPAGSPMVGEVKTIVTAPGAATTPSIQLPADAERGLYAWTFSYEANGGVGVTDGTSTLIEYDAYEDLTIYEDEVSRYPWSPRVETRTSDAVAEPGAELTDAIEVFDARPHVDLDVVSTLYGPLDSKPVLSATVPVGTPSVGTVTTTVTPDADGYAKATTDPLVVTDSGYYVWVDEIAQSDDLLSNAWTSQFGIASETSVVRWQPQVVTQASDAIAEVGAQLFDTLTVSGIKSGAHLEVVSQLIGPFVEQPDLADAIPAGAPVAGVVTTIVTDNGTFDTDTVTVKEGGYYVWVETIKETTEFKAWASKFGIAEETTFVRWKPEIKTQTSHAVAVPGTDITDELTVTGIHDGMTLTVTSTVYGPLDSKPVQSATVPAGTPIAGVVTTTITGNGKYTTPPVKPSAGGYYTWVDEIEAGPDNSAWTSDFGVEEETTLVEWKPETSTVSSHQNAQPGDEVFDTIELSGLDPAAKVDVTSTLYGPLDVQPVEQADVPAGTPVVGVVVTKQIGNGQHKTDALKLTLPGYYVWVDEIAAAPGQRGWTSDFGVGSETTVVRWTPEVSTRTSDAVVVAPQSISDQLTLSGGAPGRTYKVQSTLWGPFDTPSDRSPQAPSSEYEFATVTTSLVADAEGKGQAETAKVELTQSGYYFWSETIIEDDENALWQSDYWIAEETTVAKWQPHVTTVTSQEIAEPGTALHDNIVVTGIPEGTSVDVVSTLLGPFKDRPALSSTLPQDAPRVGQVTTTVTWEQEGTTVSTGSVVISESGYYVWVESIEASDVTTAWQSKFGVVEETTVIPWQPKITTKTSHVETEATLNLSDFLYVTGAKPNSAVDVVSTLYGPFDEKPTLSDDVPKNAPVVGTVTTTITGDGMYQTPELKLPDVGYYVWVDRIDATYDGLAWHSKFGEPNEITYAWPYSGGGGAEDPPSGGGGADEPLPKTGAEIMGLVLAAGALVGVGVAAVVTARKRRKS